MPIAWKWKAKDKDGKYIEAAPGNPFFFCRGPETRQDMIRGAKILLDNRRLDSIRFGLGDPGFVLDEKTLEPVEESVEAVLGGKPLASLKPLDLPGDRELAAAHDRLIEENDRP